MPSRTPYVLAALLWLHAAASANPPPGKAEDTRLAELIHELKSHDRDSMAYGAARTRRIELIRAIADYDALSAAQNLVRFAREPEYAELQEEILLALADHRHFLEYTVVRDLFLDHMGHDDPTRDVARRWLLDLAIRRRDVNYPRKLFEEGTVEDRFLALETLGRIGSSVAVEVAEELLGDRTWKPGPDGPVGCATIARSVARNEGPRAAQLLLRMQQDPRYRPEDEAAVREATRLWRKPDLVSHIQLGSLADPDPERRAEMARFMGQAGIEAARAPLFRLLARSDEPAPVRAAAAEALGGLSIARGDLARRLAKHLEDRDEGVRAATVRGLARLSVRQSAEILASQLRGPLDAEVRAALAKATRLPPDTDWGAWAASPDCPWPEGT